MIVLVETARMSVAGQGGTPGNVRLCTGWLLVAHSGTRSRSAHSNVLVMGGEVIREMEVDLLGTLRNSWDEGTIRIGVGRTWLKECTPLVQILLVVVVLILATTTDVTIANTDTHTYSTSREYKREGCIQKMREQKSERLDFPRDCVNFLPPCA
ncbi:hypothetical protein CBL_14333 [Carabus blaptoides fortunei]